MAYQREILKKAFADITESAGRRRSRYDRAKSDIYEKAPRLYEIDEKILALGPKIGLAAMSGEQELLARRKEEVTALAEEKKELMERYGFAEYLPACQKCGDTGLINGKYCYCVQKRAQQLSYEALCAVAPAESCRFDNFNIEYYPENLRGGIGKIYAMCRDYAQNFSEKSGNLMFTGGTGLGKTHLSLSIAAEVIKKGYGVIYGPADNLLREAEKEHFSYSDSTPAIDGLLSCDLLIIDDLGTEFTTKYSLSTVYNLLNTRILAARPTIISTNLGIDEIEKRYTPRVASRIIGNFTVKLFKGNDIRQIKARKID